MTKFEGMTKVQLKGIVGSLLFSRAFLDFEIRISDFAVRHSSAKPVMSEAERGRNEVVGNVR